MKKVIGKRKYIYSTLCIYLKAHTQSSNLCCSRVTCIASMAQFQTLLPGLLKKIPAREQYNFCLLLEKMPYKRDGLCLMP